MSGKNFFFKAALLLLFASSFVDATVFRQGRYKNGFIRAPTKPEGVQLPPDMWFEQKLDHFNPQDQRTWQQVGRRFLIKSFK